MGGGGALEVRLTGALRASVGTRSVGEADLGGRRPRLLLAALALHDGRSLSRDELADILWSDDVPPTWGAALRGAASKVRAALAPLLGDGHDPIATTSAGYALALPAGVDQVVDITAAVAAVEQAATALRDGDAAAAVAAIGRARPTLERPLLGDDAGSWVEHRREHLRQELVHGLEVLAQARLTLGEPALAAAAAEDALELQPFRESAHRVLISAQEAAGNRGEALRAYERCRRLLADELGVDPSPETQALYQRVLGEEPAAEATPALPGRLRLVGRKRPLDVLGQLLAHASAGRGGVAVVTGEPGIGKTRVVRELAERAAAGGANVLWGTCREPEWAPPFGAVVDLLGDLAELAPPQLTDRLRARLLEGDGDVPADERLRVREDLRRALLAAAHVAPLVVVIDDLHWADDGTLAALRHLAPSLSATEVLVVATVRDDEVAAEGAVGVALAALTREPGLTRIPLPPLDAAAVAELVESVQPGTPPWEAEEIQAETGGNPFYVEALLLHRLSVGFAGDSTGAPTAVRDVVGQRVARLSETCRALLRTASLIEGAFRLDAVAAAAELTEPQALDAVDEALAARLVEGNGAPDTYEFAHAIARHAIRDGVPPSRRVRLHRRVADAIEAMCDGHPGPAECGELAGQYHRSASMAGAERGVDYALRAADHAEAAGGAGTAAAFLGMALDLLPPGDGRAAAIAARRGLALITANRSDDGAAIVRAAAESLLAEGAAPAAARLLADGAWAAEMAGSTTVAYALASSGLALVGEGPQDEVWARLYILDLRRREADDPRGLGLPIATPERRRAARLLHQDPTFRRYVAWAVWDHRREILERGMDDVWALTMWGGRYLDALPMWQRAATAAEGRGQLAEAVNAWAGAASCAVALGHLEDAEEMTEHARELARRIDLRGAFALHLLGARDHLVHARATGFDELMEWMAELTVQSTDRAQRWAEATTYSALARLLAVEGRRDDARSLLDGIVEVLPNAPTFVVSTNRMVGDTVAAAWLSRDTRHLAVMADAVRRVLVEPDFRCPMTDPRHAQARMLGLGGEVEGARRWFGEAREVAATDGLRALAPIIDHDEALLLLRAGQVTEAAPLLESASAAAAAVGMVGWVRRVERLALGRVG